MDNKTKLQKLDHGFMERYYNFDESIGMFELLEKNGRFPRFLYVAEDYAVYVQGKNSEDLYIITYEVKTLGDLERWYELMFKMDLPF